MAQAMVEAAKAMELAINGESRRQSMSAEHGGTSENTRNRMEPSLRQPFFNWSTKDKYIECKNFKIEVTNIF